MCVLRELIIIAIFVLIQFSINDHPFGYNQTEYCHEHYANGTILCHIMPLNMTMPVS